MTDVGGMTGGGGMTGLGVGSLGVGRFRCRCK